MPPQRHLPLAKRARGAPPAVDAEAVATAMMKFDIPVQQILKVMDEADAENPLHRKLCDAELQKFSKGYVNILIIVLNIGCDVPAAALLPLFATLGPLRTFWGYLRRSGPKRAAGAIIGGYLRRSGSLKGIDFFSLALQRDFYLVQVNI